MNDGTSADWRSNFISCALAIVTFCTPALGQTVVSFPTKGAEFLDALPALVEITSPAHGTSTIGLRNAADVDVWVRLYLLAYDQSGHIVETKVTLAQDSPLKARKSQLIVLDILWKDGDLPVSGYLTLDTAKGTNTSEVSVSQSKGVKFTFRPKRVLINKIVFSSLLISALLVTFSWVRLKCQSNRITTASKVANDDLRMRDEMGLPMWDYSKSWASNLTAAGAILGSALTVMVLPESTYILSKSIYLALSYLFLGLATLAPFIYNSIRKPLVSQTPDASGSTLTYHGYVILFLVSSMLTVWAVLGQLATVFIIFDEIYRSSSLSFSAVRSMQAVIIFGCFAICYYCVISIEWTVLSQKLAKQTGDLRSNDIGGTIQMPLPRWAIL